MLKLVVLVALVAAANGASCPAVCSTCFAGGAGGGISLVGGVCHASCSASGYCGTSDAYTNGGTDCTGCAETPTVSQRANLKLADAHFVTNTKASITAAELLYKQTVVEFSALFNAGSLLTKSAKARYNYLLDLDSRKPAAEQAFSTGTATVVADPSNDWKWCVLPSEQRLFDFRDSAVNENACIAACEDNANCVAVARGKHPGAGLMGSWCIGCPVPLSGAHGSRTWAYKKISADTSKTPYAASELSSLLGRRSNDQCSDGKQNGDETGVDCGGSCSVCPVDCVFSETTCTCTSACGNTCDCTDTITITTPAAGRGQACPSATVRTFAGAACPPAYTDLGSGVCATGGKRLPYCQRGDGQTHQPSWGTMGAALLPTYPGSPNGRFAVAIDCEPACTNDPNCIGYNPYSHNGWCHLYFKAGVPLTDTTWTTEGGGWCNYVTQTGDMDGQDGTEGGTCFKKN